ncbi:unnamed protein product, partial [marine sediment metagenome]
MSVTDMKKITSCLKSFPVKASPQQYERWMKQFMKDWDLERTMWSMYCGWGQPANMISYGARMKVITITQLLGDGEEYLKKHVFPQIKRAEQRAQP